MFDSGDIEGSEEHFQAAFRVFTDLVNKVPDDLFSLRWLSIHDERFGNIARARANAGGMHAVWTPGEAGAHARLDEFADGAALNYQNKRNIPGVDGTSRMSPHLHFGEIGPRQVWRLITARALADSGNPMPVDIETYLSEIAWREFSYHLLFHFPRLPAAPLRPEFVRFPWIENAKGLSVWQRGLTGYPIVDAGMRQLWSTGWMHNRVRMIVASFLIRDLLVHWQVREKWFWDTLVDADLASNSANWQWVAGCGADASPYFRVFSP
ncbi:hypothetical protein GCM10007874_60170 [Labrys miyagiensis]|uniref:Cryptochrome/DNA photolyase FAD-binding domain-containing protein n=1 Tax=Labrys miyagiensis TaxID=346912 RepID=A0ABQ6CRQ9_9HYPH|nr:hypothetical protein GCM10007874_60170 [Labrys miyagiensis]